MPALSRRVCAAVSALAVSTAFSLGARANPPPNSSLDAQLFYQLLIGEIELREGSPGTAYEVMLDAARRTKDEQLFRRAVEVALQARAGDQALAAAKAWRAARPASADAHRYLVQILVALNRPGETVEPLRSLLTITPAAERGALIEALPRFFARGDRAEAPKLLMQVLQGHLEAPETRVAAQVALGRSWLAAAEPGKALEAARRAHGWDAAADAPALLAIELLPQQAAAEPIVVEHLAAKPASHGVRLMYARMLTVAQRFGEAVTQLETLTRAQPDLAPPYLTLGALQVELREGRAATATLQRYVELVRATPAPTAAPAAAGDDDAGDRGLTQAYLLLAQAAEQQRDFTAAEAWLGRIDNPQRALDVQLRRGSLLVRQGKVAEARALIQRVPEAPPVDARAKVLAESQLLRDARLWGEAYTLLGEAAARTPGDVDLLYEQSMMAEKLNRLDEMERLLRRVIEIKPDHHHAYNALGYSLADRGLRLAEAKALIQKALELSPGEPFITDSLGWVEYRLGNREEALRLLRAAYKARPDVEIGAHLGEVLWASGQRDEARRVWREARGRDASNEVLRETLARLKVDL